LQSIVRRTDYPLEREEGEFALQMGRLL